MLSTTAVQRLHELIGAYAMHDTVPVDIASFAEIDGIDLDYTDRLPGLVAIAVKIDTFRHIGVSAGNPRYMQRHGIAHEWAHWIADHGDSVHTMESQPLWFRKEEAEADRIAAVMLIPDWVLMECDTIAQVAAVCDVPVDLVRIRVSRVRSIVER